MFTIPPCLFQLSVATSTPKDVTESESQKIQDLKSKR